MGTLYINGKDAKATWGIDIEDSGLAVLLTPPPVKDYITNTSRREHGTRQVDAPVFKAQREITLPIHLIVKPQNEWEPTQTSNDVFFEQYSAFCEELAQGRLNITTTYQPNVVYKCVYVSCAQFQSLIGGMAKFTLKLIEYNPNDRGQ